jgi:hypothetical protein
MILLQLKNMKFKAITMIVMETCFKVARQGYGDMWFGGPGVSLAG